MEDTKRRYVGIDLGKREYTMAIIGKKGKMSIHQGKTSDKGRQALYRLLEKGDKIARTKVRLKRGTWRSSGMNRRRRTKRTRRTKGSMKLAHIVEERRDEKLPIVPLPSEKEMARRKLLASYFREQRNRTRHINTLHALFVHQGQTTVVRSNLRFAELATAERRKETVKLLSGQEREEADWILKYLDLHEQRIAQLKKRIYDEAKTDPHMKNLQTVAGVGPVVAYAFMAHVGTDLRTGAK